MAKMYYSEEETGQALGVELDGLMELVNSAKLQMYQDGPKHVYKAGDVDALVQEMGAEAPAPGEVEIELSSVGEDPSAQPAAPKKEDTVITAEGISIFDDEDLEIDEADPMAETQVAPSLDDQIALDGVGSGSGLLDLTRESDDTSLGAEVLDHIDMEGSGISSGLSSRISGGISGLGSGLGSGLDEGGLDTLSTAPAKSAGYPQTTTEPPTFIEAIDPSSGLYGGLLVGSALIILIVTATTLAAQQGIVSGFLDALQKNLTIVLVIMVVITIIAALVGYLLGKAFQTKQEALKHTG